MWDRLLARGPPETLRGVFPESLALPLTLTYRDSSGPFVLETTVTACHPLAGAGPADAFTLTLGSGTLHDADKGRFALDGVVLTLRLTRGRFEPVALVTPGALSDFQQAGLLDAVASAFNHLPHISRSKP